jgi:hypothetical protein
MTFGEILVAQLTDPFRLALIVGLVLTILRTEAVTGRWVPLALGLLFVAFIIPATMARDAASPLWQLVAVGLVANLVLLAVVMAIRHLVLRIMP